MDNPRREALRGGENMTTTSWTDLQYNEGIGWTRRGWRGIPERVAKRVWMYLRFPIAMAELRRDLYTLESDLIDVSQDVERLEGRLSEVEQSVEHMEDSLQFKRSLDIPRLEAELLR